MKLKQYDAIIIGAGQAGVPLAKKLAAIACFESQAKIRPYLQPEIIKATAHYWSRFNNYQLAEPMEIVRERLLTPQDDDNAYA